MYDNWNELPSDVTGCEKRCFCDMGNVSCQAACPPIPAMPPATLPCSSYQAKLAKLPGDDCCQKWICDTSLITPGIYTFLFYQILLDALIKFNCNQSYLFYKKERIEMKNLNFKK